MLKVKNEFLIFIFVLVFLEVKTAKAIGFNSRRGWWLGLVSLPATVMPGDAALTHPLRGGAPVALLGWAARPRKLNIAPPKTKELITPKPHDKTKILTPKKTPLFKQLFLKHRLTLALPVSPSAVFRSGRQIQSQNFRFLFGFFLTFSSLFLPSQVGHFLLRVGLFGRAEQNPSAKTSLITCVGAKSN